jgi:hypothetical protein
MTPQNTVDAGAIVWTPTDEALIGNLRIVVSPGLWAIYRGEKEISLCAGSSLGTLDDTKANVCGALSKALPWKRKASNAHCGGFELLVLLVRFSRTQSSALHWSVFQGPERVATGEAQTFEQGEAYAEEALQKLLSQSATVGAA